MYFYFAKLLLHKYFWFLCPMVSVEEKLSTLKIYSIPSTLTFAQRLCFCDYSYKSLYDIPLIFLQIIKCFSYIVKTYLVSNPAVFLLPVSLSLHTWAPWRGNLLSLSPTYLNLLFKLVDQVNFKNLLKISWSGQL